MNHFQITQLMQNNSFLEIETTCRDYVAKLRIEQAHLEGLIATICVSRRFIQEYKIFLKTKVGL